MALLRLNAICVKFIANVKRHIYARTYTDVNINANIYNTFTAYVKVQTYLHFFYMYTVLDTS